MHENLLLVSFQNFFSAHSIPFPGLQRVTAGKSSSVTGSAAVPMVVTTGEAFQSNHISTDMHTPRMVAALTIRVQINLRFELRTFDKLYDNEAAVILIGAGGRLVMIFMALV